MSQSIQDCLNKIKIRYPGSPQPIGLQKLIEGGELVNLLTKSYPRLGPRLCSRIDLDSGDLAGGVQFIPELDPSVKSHRFLKPEQLQKDTLDKHEQVSFDESFTKSVFGVRRLARRKGKVQVNRQI